MLRKLLPILLALAGLAGGIGAGLVLRPADDGSDHATAETPAAGDHAQNQDDASHEIAGDHEDGAGDAVEGLPEYVKMNNQFVIPVVEDGHVDAMVVLSISLEVDTGLSETVFQHEPKLRDAFLQVMFDHANVGGFSGTFTDGSNLIVLRTNLKEAAALILGTVVRDVLITDIARQDS